MSRLLLPLVLFAACARQPAPEPALTATPLRERAATPGPRFQRLDPKTTGLDFTNTLQPQNTVPYVYVGGGVAIGDYDGDGLPDVFLCSLDGPNKLFKQVAPMRFVDVTAQAGGPNGGLDGGDAWSTAAAFADVDGDGRLDLYVCNFESPNQLWLNNGDGTFRECAGQFGLAITAACTGCAFADYDGDGDLDLYVVTDRMFGPALAQEIVDEVQLPTSVKKTRAQLFPPYPRFERRDGKAVVPEGYEDFFAAVEDQIVAAGQRDYLMRNDGHGRFRDATEEAGIRGHGTGLSACWWDCDGDGRPDLYVANDLEAPDQLWHNRGDGTFEEITTKALPHVAYFGMGCDFGDIDGDGRFDFCVADMSSTTHYMGKMLMGSMGDKRWFLMHSDPQQYMRNAVFLNTGTGRFLEAGYLLGLASTDWTWTVRFVDLDEDGRLDFYATNGIPRFEDNPDTVAEFRRLLRSGHKAEALALARNLEPVLERNVARRNAGDLRFVDCGKEWGLDELGVSQAAAFADLDRDGDLDL
ncbi:MAG TPA: VCBS repeat-containing protein, partial [Burkholderiaceae bacterium]|nr:VCBS repeat-containing protein [Burkholderiaceae bacterium]